MQTQPFPCLRTFHDSDEIEVIALSPDGRTLFSGGWYDTIKVWNVTTGQLQRTLTGPPHTVEVLAMSPNGQILASSSDETIKLWDLDTGEVRHTIKNYFEEASKKIASLVFSLDGQILYSGSQGNTTHYWNVNGGYMLGSLGMASSGSKLLALSADGRTLAGTSPGWLIVNDLPQHTRRFKTQTGYTTSSLAISPDGETVFMGDYKGIIYVYDIRQREEVARLKGYAGAVQAIAVSPDGKILASANGISGGMIKLWELSARTEMTTLEGHSRGISGLIFGPDSQTLISSSFDKSIKVWAVR